AKPGTTPDSPGDASTAGADLQSADAASEASADNAQGETTEKEVSQAELDALMADTGLSLDEAAVAAGDSDSGADAVAAGGVYMPPEVVDTSGSGDAGRSIEILNDVALDVSVELGRTQMRVEDVLRLGPGSVVELDKLAGDPVEIFVNERLIARGEVLVLNDDFCVRVSEIVSPVEERAQG
ncbi:MAG: flagellar motor switch protein FliN, partial [Phycisphaerae bacterium]